MKNLFNPEKRVVLTLVGLDGNAFALMGAFSAAAKIQGWSNADIKMVIDECKSGDYDHLLQTLIVHTEDMNIAEDVVM